MGAEAVSCYQAQCIQPHVELPTIELSTNVDTCWAHAQHLEHRKPEYVLKYMAARATSSHSGVW